jgi:hypothetical protein
MDWKLIVLAPVAVGLLAGCQSKSDDPDSPHSPYAGLWVNDQSVNALNDCQNDQDFNGQNVVLDAINIHQDGQVLRYSFENSPRAEENLSLGQVDGNGDFTRKISSPGTASYGFNYGPTDLGDPRLAMYDGVFGKVDDNHMYLTDMNGRVQKTFVRSSDDEMRQHRTDILKCLGRRNVQASQNPPPGYPQQPPPGYQQQRPYQGREPLPPPQGYSQPSQPDAQDAQGR